MNAKTAEKAPQNDRKTPQFTLGWAPGYPKSRYPGGVDRLKNAFVVPAERPVTMTGVIQAGGEVMVVVGKGLALSAGAIVGLLGLSVKLLCLLSATIAAQAAQQQQLADKRRRWRRLSAEDDTDNGRASCTTTKTSRQTVVIVKTKVTVK